MFFLLTLVFEKKIPTEYQIKLLDLYFFLFNCVTDYFCISREILEVYVFYIVNVKTSLGGSKG